MHGHYLHAMIICVEIDSVSYEITIKMQLVDPSYLIGTLFSQDLWLVTEILFSP